MIKYLFYFYFMYLFVFVIREMLKKTRVELAVGISLPMLRPFWFSTEMMEHVLHEKKLSSEKGHFYVLRISNSPYHFCSITKYKFQICFLYEIRQSYLIRIYFPLCIQSLNSKTSLKSLREPLEQNNKRFIS